jgi:hypothetical protein
LLGAACAALVVVACNGHLESKSDAAAQPAASRAAGTSEGDGGYADDSDSGDSGYDDQSADEGSAAGDSGGYASEADRTQAMESQGDDLERQYRDARANAKTPEQAEQAYQKFERDRAKLDATGQGVPPPR